MFASRRFAYTGSDFLELGGLFGKILSTILPYVVPGVAIGIAPGVATRRCPGGGASAAAPKMRARI